MAKQSKNTTKSAATKSAAKKATKGGAKKATAKRAATERKPHVKILDNMRITLTAKGKDGSGRRSAKASRTGKVFAYYKNGMSVEQFLAKPDARRVDVLADFERGNITLAPKPVV